LTPSSCRQTHSFVEKVRDIVGLYFYPPDRAIILSMDEKAKSRLWIGRGRSCRCARAANSGRRAVADVVMVSLRGRYRLMRRPPRSKPAAVVGERQVEDGLQYLQHCLLDKSVESSGHAEFAHATIWLGYLDTSDRPRWIQASQQLVPMLWPVRPQVVRGSTVIPSMPGLPLFVSHPGFLDRTST
jgi:hypothetical protein